MYWMSDFAAEKLTLQGSRSHFSRTILLLVVVVMVETRAK